MKRTRSTPCARPSAPSRPPRWARIASALLIAPLLCSALAHATIVFGTLDVEPDPPPPNARIAFELTLTDPTGTPVEDAIVRAELSPVVPVGAGASLPEAGTDPDAADTSTSERDDAPVLETRFEEVRPGAYRAELTSPPAGTYEILLRDQTFRQEEATQIIAIEIGSDESIGTIEFLFPPTATGGGLAAWLLWLVAIPVVAGIVVTFLVLQKEPPPNEEARSADET